MLVDQQKLLAILTEASALLCAYFDFGFHNVHHILVSCAMPTTHLHKHHYHVPEADKAVDRLLVRSWIIYLYM